MGKNLHRAVCRAGFFGGCSEHGRVKNCLACTCLRSILGKMKNCSTVWIGKFKGAATVEQILIEGDRMYFNVLESQNISDTETKSLIYLSNQVRWNLQSMQMKTCGG